MRMTRSWEETGTGGGVPRVKTFHWRRPLGTLMCLFVSSTEGGTADALMESAERLLPWIPWEGKAHWDTWQDASLAFLPQWVFFWGAINGLCFFEYCPYRL